MTVPAFWSYRRDDDDSEQGRISEFARHVASQFELLSGDSLTLFLDRDSLLWGADWEEGVAKAVDAAMFFIPVYTPRYFKSRMCRAEFRSFVTKARNLGATERVLGLTYIDVPDMSINSNDQIKVWAATYQHAQIDIRWIEPDSLQFRREASVIAKRLVLLEAELAASVDLANESAQSVTSDIASISSERILGAQVHRDVERTDDGYLELVRATEAVLPDVENAIQPSSETLTELLRRTRELERTLKNAPTANAKVALLTRYVSEIQPICNILELNTDVFTSGVESMDIAVQAIYRWPNAELTADELLARRELANRVSNLQRQAEQVSSPLNELQPAIRNIAKQSKVASASLSRLYGTTLKLTDGQAVVRQWKLVHERPRM